ncbi:MAG: hypothetical protein FWF08_04695 [Oscillospiraceae bacterium]|nr:hypothetical protein [Oscillospiraceae bacterium]
MNRFKKLSAIICAIFIAFTALFAFPASAVEDEPLLAFPGADGVGKYTAGGRGGDVYVVTSLEDTREPGTLRWACEASGPRTVVFDVAGTIEMKSRLWINNGDITIAGQTAPGDGISLKGWGFVFDGVNNVIVRNIRVRLGDSEQENCIWITHCNNVIIDHCSFAWSINKGVVTSDSDNVTIQWCYITEGLFDSIWWGGRHSRGALLYGHDGQMLSCHHNLFAHNDARNPRAGGTVPPDEDPVGFFCDITNNVMYDWGREYVVKNLDDDFVCTMNILNNYMIAGPSSNASNILIDRNVNTRYIIDGNFMNGKKPADEYKLITHEEFKKPAVTDYNGLPWKLDEPFDAKMDTIHDAEKAYSMVMANGGASVSRDAVDIRIINDVLTGCGRVIDSQDEVGGWPVLDTNPTVINAAKAAWFDEYGFEPYDPAYCNEIDPESGYTYLELFCNGLMDGLYDEDVTFPQFSNSFQWFKNIMYRLYRVFVDIRNFFLSIPGYITGLFE